MKRKEQVMQRVLLFDVNETLLDLAGLHESFAVHLGSEKITTEWFNQLIQSAMLSVIVGNYSNFAEIGKAALRMVAERHRVTLNDEIIGEIVGKMRTLPAHADVAEGLANLRENQYRMAALTNSPTQVANEQLANAGIKQYFEKVISVEEVKTVKPDPKVYHHAAKSMDCLPSDCRLIACHSWDVAGAMSVGIRGGFIRRAGMIWNPLFAQPDVVGDHLIDVASEIVRVDSMG
ncbi:MAG: haloacid dehalogenase type II [Burkholderiales bacterium]|jgi:2-haloacid dehalogenase